DRRPGRCRVRHDGQHGRRLGGGCACARPGAARAEPRGPRRAARHRGSRLPRRPEGARHHHADVLGMPCDGHHARRPGVRTGCGRIRRRRGAHPACPRVEQRLDQRQWPAQAARRRHLPAELSTEKVAHRHPHTADPAGTVARGGLPAVRERRDRGDVALRVDRMHGDVPLQGVRGTLPARQGAAM
ncbi:MAG: 1,2-phenylacetyl-CoA epoxidase, subunit D, partial [uncultured Nocardioidaceae bacterium]